MPKAEEVYNIMLKSTTKKEKFAIVKTKIIKSTKRPNVSY